MSAAVEARGDECRSAARGDECGSAARGDGGAVPGAAAVRDGVAGAGCGRVGTVLRACVWSGALGDTQINGVFGEGKSASQTQLLRLNARCSCRIYEEEKKSVPERPCLFEVKLWAGITLQVPALRGRRERRAGGKKRPFKRPSGGRREAAGQIRDSFTQPRL